MGNKFTSELFDEFGNHQKITFVHSIAITDEDIKSQIIPNNHFLYGVNEKEIVEVSPDYDSYVPNFG